MGSVAAANSRAEISRLGALYDRVYTALCGEHPSLRPWHFQWLCGREIYADLRRALAGIEGRVLDVGCGDKPYAAWMPGAKDHVGIDVYAGPKVDKVITPDAPWPFETASFDAILCTQVLEHVADFENVRREIRRTLKPGGQLIVTIPFAFNVHAHPHDYRRFSAYGIRLLFEEAYEIAELKPQGAIGTTLGTYLLNWLDMVAGHNRLTRLLKGPALPLWIPFCGLVNLVCIALDALDPTGAFYHNVFLHARKR